jgi:peptidyl-tRNA hydrolase, PTH1 family
MNILRRIYTKEVNKQNDPSSPVFLIIGLGNPGRQYKENRHNIGFKVIDRFSERLEFSFSRVQFRSLVADIRYKGIRIYFSKPQTYMNESGQAAATLVKFFKIHPDKLLVIYDDVDLPFGTLRLRPEGGSAGQKGVASIIERLGTKEFPRLRVGVGRPPGQMPASAYVLQNFTKQEAEFLPEILDRAVDASLTWITEGLESAMNKYNGTVDL